MSEGQTSYSAHVSLGEGHLMLMDTWLLCHTFFKRSCSLGVRSHRLRMAVTSRICNWIHYNNYLSCLLNAFRILQSYSGISNMTLLNQWRTKLVLLLKELVREFHVLVHRLRCSSSTVLAKKVNMGFVSPCRQGG